MSEKMHVKFGAIPARRRRVALAAGIVLPAGLTAFAFARTGGFSGEAQDESKLQTATVRSGDLVLKASGTGTLMAQSEIRLGFGDEGTIAALHVQVGDQVVAGDILAEQSECK